MKPLIMHYLVIDALSKVRVGVEHSLLEFYLYEGFY